MTIGSYTFQTVTVPGANGTELAGINNAGELSGSAKFGYPSAAFAISSVGIDIYGANGEPYGAFSIGEGISASGHVVGSSGHYPTTARGYLYSGGSFTEIDGPQNRYSTRAFGINDSDQVVGAAVLNSGQAEPIQGYIWQNGTMSLFQVPGASATEAHGINNGGTIVGSVDNYGFIDTGGQFGLFGLGQITEVNAINNTGAVAGDFFDGTHWHGFIDAAGQVTTVDAPGAVNTHVTGINDDNTIVGYFDAGGPTMMGFIATDPPPADPVKTLVREEYVGLFGRDADPGAQTFWASLLKAGAMTPRDFVWALTQSPEGQWLHGGQTGEQFVNSVYMNALGRPADPGTQAAWAGVMRAGAGSWDVLSAISTSLEGSMHLAAVHG